MGLSSLWHWVIVLIVVLLIFGGKKLRGLGEDIGIAIKGFKQGLNEGSMEQSNDDAQQRTLNSSKNDIKNN